jgi:hypothetical protein
MPAQPLCRTPTGLLPLGSCWYPDPLCWCWLVLA